MQGQSADALATALIGNQLILRAMAGNKYDTPFARIRVDKVKIEYVGLYKTPVAFEGSIDQAIRHLTSLK